MPRLKFECFSRDDDGLLFLACAFPPPRHGATFEPEKVAGRTYTMLHNLTGWPATVVRAGTSLEGLPIAVRISAHYWRESVSLRPTREIEQQLGGFQLPVT